MAKVVMIRVDDMREQALKFAHQYLCAAIGGNDSFERRALEEMLQEIQQERERLARE